MGFALILFVCCSQISKIGRNSLQCLSKKYWGEPLVLNSGVLNSGCLIRWAVRARVAGTSASLPGLIEPVAEDRFHFGLAVFGNFEVILFAGYEPDAVVVEPVNLGERNVYVRLVRAGEMQSLVREQKFAFASTAELLVGCGEAIGAGC